MHRKLQASSEVDIPTWNFFTCSWREDYLRRTLVRKASSKELPNLVSHSLYSKQIENNAAFRLDKQRTNQAYCTPGGNLSSCLAQCVTRADLPEWTKLRCCGRMY